MILDASDFMWHLLSSLPALSVWWWRGFFLETVCDYGAKQPSIFRLNPTENEYLLPCCLRCISLWPGIPNVL